MPLQIIPSRDVKVAGLLGPASPMDKKGVSVAETVVGLGGTTQWSVRRSTHDVGPLLILTFSLTQPTDAFNTDTVLLLCSADLSTLV